MRFASVLIPCVLFAASAAWAEPPQSSHDDQTLAGAGKEDPRDSGRADQPAPQPTRAAFPSYSNDRTTEANCFFVFGELRCDRVPNRAHGTTKR